MDTASAIIWSRVNRNSPMMVFDWIKAAEIIRDRLLLGTLKEAAAGLQSDWEWTGGLIFSKRSIVPRDETYTFLSSNWAKPELRVDNEVLECFCLRDKKPEWGSGTYWPPEALEILKQALPSP
jgi:hypothetical protein